MTRHNKIICIMLLVAFGVMLSGFGAYNLYTTEQERLFNEKVEAAAAPYKLEQVRYTTEMYNLERELYSMLPCGATMTMVVTALDEMLYTTVYPIFKGTSRYNSKNESLALVGTVCLSDTELPGGEGNITLEQFEELMDEGWTAAIHIDHKDASDLPGYLDKLAGELSALGISMPNTAYFISGAYNTDLDAALFNHGIRNVIHHEERGLDLIGTDLESAMWRAGDIGWNSPGVANASFTALISSAGSLVFSLGFEEWDSTRRFVGDDMGNASFSRMLDKFRECVRSESMLVGSLSDGKEAYREHNAEYLRLSPTLEPRRRELQAKIDDVNAILFRIYSGDFSVVEEEE